MPFLVGGNSGIGTPIAPGGLGHQFEDGPDGGTYFAVLGPSLNLVASIRNIYEAIRIYNSYPGGRGRDQARALEVIATELETAVHASGVATAQMAEHTAKDLLNKRIHRPTTPKPDHLIDAIVARSLTVRGAPGSWGAVGIGDIAALDAFPYWKAQEFGSTHNVGRTLRGYFYEPGGPTPAGAAPSGSQAIFRPGKGPKMVIENPIRGKAFLTDATFAALDFRYGIWQNIQKASVAQVRSVRIATLGDLKGTRLSRTLGGFERFARFRP